MVCSRYCEDIQGLTQTELRERQRQIRLTANKQLSRHGKVGLLLVKLLTVHIMATFGRIEEFSGDKEASWDEYAEWLECFFVANEIVAAEKKRAVLFSVCGAAAYSMLRSLVAPKRPSEVPYAELIGSLQRHFSLRPSEIVQRFHFHNCKQQPGQSISAFIAELRKLSVHCNFGDQLENMLHDRIVCGVRDPALQRQLLSETALTFKSAEEKATAAETAALNASMLRMGVSAPQSEEVHKTTHTTDTKKEMGATMEVKKKCFRCGAFHSPSECKFSTAVSLLQEEGTHRTGLHEESSNQYCLQA